MLSTEYMPFKFTYAVLNRRWRRPDGPLDALPRRLDFDRVGPTVFDLLPLPGPETAVFGC